MFSTVYTKPGDQLNRIHDRPLALIASKKAYDHFVDYTTEKHRMAILAEKEVKRLTEIKKATYEMSKTWDNTIENIKKKKEEELLAKNKKEEVDKIQFMEEMAAKKAAEHAEIINEAKKLILYTKPQCRLINRALLTSECLRELDEQLEFQKNLKLLEKEEKNETSEMIKQEIKKHEEEERKKAEELMMKNKIYADELKKQIHRNKCISKREEEIQKETAKQELSNIARKIEMEKNLEIEELELKKKKLREQFLKALEDKRKHELKVKRDEKFEEQAMAVYNKGKQQIESKLNHQIKKEKEERIRRSEYLAKKCAAIANSRVAEEEIILKKALEKKEIEENEKKVARKQYEEKLRVEMEKYRQELAILLENQKKEDEKFKAWEIKQRLERDKFDKNIKAQDYEREKLKKQKMAKTLRKQIALKEIEQKRIEELDNKNDITREIIEKTNEKILRYGEEVLKESDGVRPLFPIIKVLQQFKNEVRPKSQNSPARTK
ncbi:cilia- and flagella- associated protein 210-like [Leptopilina boulardi]|uniref:cilia- and flagella- associated protein 210-like n=1 Tax=Leptopilina boulardi TaxID=63433 RepID=UPI0021F5CFF8|nr:cilia- and flagella- associated protein 210-like [Leptopilina boulardi]